ncbi:Heterokaryon incompatibility [Macrophomina phaseolina MS6]|uniref:Heterokaryon incompatibility n=1 Tax=Macrophomina phaseolina (strain MS6) TaxID=1126212 RepID=K2R9F7_MACPH|nr:Heterokaryon incompatibility [Macrophomina phaseolina MS6]
MMIPIYHSTVPVTSTFRHAPLDDGRQFRLLKLYPAHFALRKDAPWLIEYEIVHCSLDNAPPYEAISYVWGSHDKTHMIRLLPGNRTLAVTASVDKVLSDMKKHSTTGYLWIDQFCISQEDELERSHQVTLMGEIYSKARRTLVWTGEPNGYLEDLVGTLKVLGAPSKSNAFRRSRNDAHAEVQRDALRIRAHLESMFPSACSRHSTVRGPGSDVMDMDAEDQSEDEGHCRKCVDAFADNFADSTSRFLARQPVFSRCWIVQEVLLARQVYLAAGDVLVSPNDFHRVLSATFLVPKLEKAASKTGHFPDEEPSLHSLNFMAFFWDSFEHGEIPLFSSLLVNLRDGALAVLGSRLVQIVLGKGLIWPHPTK